MLKMIEATITAILALTERGAVALERIADGMATVPHTAAEAPKRGRGRPSKAELAAREAAAAEAKPNNVTPIKPAAEGPDPLDLGAEEPETCACGAVLTPENTSKSKVDGRTIHVGCPADEEPAAKKIPTLEEFRAQVMKWIEAHGGKPAGAQKMVELLKQTCGAEKVSDVPEARRFEVLAAMADADEPPSAVDDLLG